MDESILKVRGVTATQKKQLAELSKQRLGRASASAYIRHLITAALGENPTVTAETQQGRKTPMSRLEIRLQQGERFALIDLAEKTKSSPQFYLVSLLRAHLLRKPQLLGAELEILRESNYQLSKIGTNLNQIARALNAREIRTVDMETIDALTGEVKKHTQTMRTIISANLERWDII